MSYTIAELEQHRKDWIAALRSGKYKQGQSYLHTLEDEYCCLGVACDISNIYEPTKGKVAYRYGECQQILPLSILDYYGFKGNEGEAIGYSKIPSLVELNDYEGFSFNDIADKVENNWYYYFTNEEASDYVG